MAPSLPTRFRTLVQSPLRAGILRFVHSRPDDVVRRRVADAGVRPDAARRGQLRRRADALRRGTTPAWRTAPLRGGPPRPGSRHRPARRLPRTAGDGQHRGPVAVGPALPRDDRPRREDADRLRVDPDRRQVRHLRAHPRPHRLGQGGGGADDPRAEPARHRALPGGQLRGAARHAVRVGDLRPREGGLHRRPRPQARPPRAGERRHAVSRRDRRPLDRRAGQAAARARGAAASSASAATARSRWTSA